jgi:predicted nucleic acid-binding protein
MARLFDSSALVDQMINHERKSSFFRGSSILDLTLYETANAFWKLWRVRRLISFEDAEAHVENLGDLRGVLRVIDVSTLDLTLVHNIARSTGLTVYDSAYIAVAHRDGLELVTVDGKLERVAKRYRSSLGGETRVVSDGPD